MSHQFPGSIRQSDLEFGLWRYLPFLVNSEALFLLLFVLSKSERRLPPSLRRSPSSTLGDF